MSRWSRTQCESPAPVVEAVGLPPRIPPLALRDPGCPKRPVRPADRAVIFMAESCAACAGGRVVGPPPELSVRMLRMDAE